MTFPQAVEEYWRAPSPQTLDRLSRDLCRQMTVRERVKMLSGSYLAFASRVIFGAIFKGSIFYLPFHGGGCRRLGVPKIRFSDGPKGAVTGHGTCFPAAIMRGATFDVDLEERVGTAIAREVIAAGGNFFAGICINLVRNPRGGRSQESYGEDPHLLGRMGATLVSSVQGEGLIACPKHFALNSIENLRFLVSSNADERALREIYLPQFKSCIDAGARSIMSAYNKVNGVYCAENRSLLHDILRSEWGFDGFVMSDFLWGVHDTAGALKAGLDCEMPVPRHYRPAKLRRLLRRGTVQVHEIDRAVAHILRALILLPPRISPQSKAVVRSADHLSLAEEAATKGMVLLKNRNAVLPLDSARPIAVVGPYANTVNVGDTGSSKVRVGKDGVTAFAGLRARFERVRLYQGAKVRKALAAAAEADTVIACIGCDRRDEGEFLINVGERMSAKPKRAIGGDRETLALKPDHLELLKALKKAGKRVVAVLFTGGVVLTEELEPYTDAIIMAYYGGVRFGTALARLLSGEVSFSGKLPVSIARREEDYPAFLEIGRRPYEIEYGYYNGYYLFDRDGVEAAYPFGFGLSYTTFSIENVSAAPREDGGISVFAEVKNTGDTPAAEVVQVYVGSEGGGDHRPLKMLRGFERLELAPGTSARVRIEVEPADLAFYDPTSRQWSLDPSYTVFVGNSSRDAMSRPVRL